MLRKALTLQTLKTMLSALVTYAILVLLDTFALQHVLPSYVNVHIDPDFAGAVVAVVAWLVLSYGLRFGTDWVAGQLGLSLDMLPLLLRALVRLARALFFPAFALMLAAALLPDLLQVGSLNSAVAAGVLTAIFDLLVVIAVSFAIMCGGIVIAIIVSATRR